MLFTTPLNLVLRVSHLPAPWSEGRALITGLKVFKKNSLRPYLLPKSIDEGLDRFIFSDNRAVTINRLLVSSETVLVNCYC